MSRAPGAVRMRRREFLRAGLAGLSGLTLPGLLALRARAGTGSTGERTALLVVWLQGGASHLETYDPKPDAPAEVRGPFGSIATTRRGRPRQRAAAAATPGWPTGSRSSARSRTRGSATSRATSRCSRGTPSRCSSSSPTTPTCCASRTGERADPGRRVPTYVGVNPIPYLGSAYLGPAYEPFAVHGDPNAPGFAVPGIGLTDAAEVARLGGRMGLAARFDGLRRAIDDTAQSDGLRRLPAAGVHAPDRPRGAAGLRPRAGKTRGSATATAGTPGASAACWPGGWSRRASTSSRRASTARSAAGSATGTTTPSTTTSSTR